MKKILILGIILGLVGLIFYIENAANRKCKIKILEQEKRIQHDIIQTQVFQQQILSKISVNVDIAARDKLLRIIFNERNNPNK